MTSARRFLPTDPADLLRAIVPLALLAIAAAIPATRLSLAVLLVAGTAVAIGRDAPVRWAWAAAVPVALSLAWGSVARADRRPGRLRLRGSPPRPSRSGGPREAVVVLGVAGRPSPCSLGRESNVPGRCAMPARRYVRWAVVGFLVTGPVALLLGPILARPFFGDVGYDVTVIGALVPALVFAVANGVMEEVDVPRRPARLVVQGHGRRAGARRPGRRVRARPLRRGCRRATASLLMLALGLGGLIAGVVAIRTRSLLLPIAIHIGLDIPIYYAFACAS